MNHKRLIILTVCWISVITLGICVISFSEETNTEAEQHFEKANELRKVADYDTAIGEYEKVISSSPNSRIAQDARYWIGQSHFQAGRLDASLAAFQTLLNEHPSSTIVASTKQMIEQVQQSKKEKTLVEAIKNGDLEQLKSLISSGVDVNSKVKAEVATWDGTATTVTEGWPLLNLAIRHRQADVATFLINKGADVNGRDGFDNHKTPLHYVAHRGTAALAKLLIANGADVNAREDGDYTPLHCVTSNNNPDRDDQLEVARILISNGANIESLDEGHRTPLWCAAGNGHLDIVKLLISKGADIEAENYMHDRPLHLAARGGQLDLVKLLISKGANVEARGRGEQTPLHDVVGGGRRSETAEATGKRLEIAKLLLDKGAFVDSRNVTENTPLSLAIHNDSADMVELLLARGAVPVRRHLGASYVGIAMGARKKEMVKFLIDKGFDYSPVHVAAFFGEIDKVKSYLADGGDIDAQSPSSSCLSLLDCAIMGGHKELAKFLINEGADINQRGGAGETALLRAVMSGGPAGHPEIVRMLLDKGADVTRVGNQAGQTALFWAARRGQKDLVEMILAKGADVNTKSVVIYRHQEHVTPLHEACLMGHTAVAEVLIAHGADVNAKTQDGKTPMDFAKTPTWRANEELIELLRKHGAKE